MNASKALLTVLAFAGVLASSASARATPDFPGAVEHALMLPAGTLSTKVDPPDGCHLCHVNGSAGGLPLTQFGTLMQEYGATPYEAAGTAGPALMAMEAMDPQAIADIENGMDPNLDPDAFGSSSMDPTPQYGCGSIAPGAPTAASGILLFLLLALFGARRRRRTAIAFAASATSVGGFVLWACGGTTGHEDLPQMTTTMPTIDATIVDDAGDGGAGGDATLDSGSSAADMDSGDFDVVIEYADRELPDVSAPVDAGSSGEGGSSSPFPSCPPWFSIDDTGMITSDPTMAATYTPSVYLADGGIGEAPDGSVCATYPWYGTSFTESCFVKKGGAGLEDYVPFPPCNWAQDSGVAAAGPQAGAQQYAICMNLYACIESSGCGDNVTTCLCGSDTASAACTANPVGPCKSQMQAAFQTSDLSAVSVDYILENFSSDDLTQPYGAPGALIGVYQSAKSIKCLLDAGPN